MCYDGEGEQDLTDWNNVRAVREEEDSQGLGTEFYPVDPLSRGMIDRLYVLNR